MKTLLIHVFIHSLSVLLSFCLSAQPGNVGINTLSPQARLHVNRNTSGGPLLSNALAIFEDNQNSFLHLSTSNSAENGILSGNQNTLIRSGLIFGLDSSIHFRSGGNFTRMVIKNGNVGINTTNPFARLHVKDSSVLFSGPSGLTFPPVPPPINGQGIRMMWYPGKASFRAGQVSSTQWDRDSIGIHSVAFGSDNIAKGAGSFVFGTASRATGSHSGAMGVGSFADGAFAYAMGNNAHAFGDESYCFGNFSEASGRNSVAIGDNAKASNENAIAIGEFTKATGPHSLAMGESTTASGNKSSAFGFNTVASGTIATSFGNATKARSYGSFVIGAFNDTTTITQAGWNLNDPLFIIGNGLDNVTRKNAITVLKNAKTGINTNSPLAMLHVQDSSVLFRGLNTLPVTPANPPVAGAGTRFMWYPDKAALRSGSVNATQWNKDSIGINSIAVGSNVKAKGYSSIALGLETTASGNAAVALGHITTASGPTSTALGYQTLASGDGALATGVATTASGYSSTSIGNFSKAMAINSFASGSGTIANGINSTSFGNSTRATGVNAIASGNEVRARSFASLAIGQFNDTTSMSLNTWELTDPVFTIGNGLSHGSRHNAMTVLKNAKTGINTTTPDAMLHVSEGAGGGIYHSASDVIIEDDATSYLQFSTPNTFESGILSGNNLTSVRSGIIFRPDSSLQIRAGGNSSRLTILKNGNTGINTTAPKKLLHVSAGTSATTPIASAVAVFEDNSDVSITLLTPAASESGIYFGNSEDAAHGGIVYNSTVANGLAFRTNKNVTKMVITDSGNVGIGDSSPNSRLHVSAGTGGANYSAEADMIVEDNSSTFIQLSSPAGSEAGILSGNNTINTRSSIRFKADSSVHITTSGNLSRIMIDKSGDVGIGGEPDAVLDVHGTTKLGNNGTILTEVIKVTVMHDIIPMLAGGSALETFSVPNATIGSSVMISPGTALQSGIIIAYARVSAAGTVEARFINTTAGAINPPPMDFFITVIK